MDYTNIIVTHPKTNSWLVVLTILKNISQWEGLSHILWKNKKCAKPTTRIYHITVISVFWNGFAISMVKVFLKPQGCQLWRLKHLGKNLAHLWLLWLIQWMYEYNHSDHPHDIPMIFTFNIYIYIPLYHWFCCLNRNFWWLKPHYD